MTINLSRITAQVIHGLYNDGNSDKAALAALRSCNSLLNPKASRIWPLLLPSLPVSALSRTGNPTPSEKASFAALHSYAIYQQGADKLVFANKDDGGKHFFRALGQLRADDKLRNALDRRMQALLMSSNFVALTKHLFSILQIFKAHNTGDQLDFGQLAQDLYYFQKSYEDARKICLRWGQEYYRTNDSNK